MRIATALFSVLLLTLSHGSAQTVSSEMDAGVEAYKSALYEKAIAHFKNVLELDPELSTAHLYLAIAYGQQYIPGADSPDNIRNGESALQQYDRVLGGKPDVEQRVQASQGRASLLYNMGRSDEAKEAYEELIKLDPEQADYYYSIAVIDWTQSYTPRMELRKSMNLEPTEELQVASACNLLRSMNDKRVEDGIQKLTKALDLRCDFDDAMAYMNLLYREKAEYECDNPEQRAADLKMANEWVDRTMQAKRARAEKAAKSTPP